MRGVRRPRGRRDVVLAANRPPERHSIHGHGWQARWTPRDVSASMALLENCFVGWSRRAVIEWPEPGTRLTMTATPPLDFLVIYTPAGRPYFCVEPVSHVTDAFNLAAVGWTDTGAHTLSPGATLRASVTLTPETET